MKEIKTYTLHPNTVAWNKFTATDEYKRLINGETISLLKRNEIYLMNRIKTAFDAGWDAAGGKK